MDLFLKFNDEEQSIKYLFDIIPAEKNELGEVTKQQELRAKFRNMDIVGPIYKPTGKTVKQQMPGGEELDVPEMVKVDGWHVNIRTTTEDITDIIQFNTSPKSPVRVWA